MSINNVDQTEQPPWYVRFADAKPTFWSTVLTLLGFALISAGAALVTYGLCTMNGVDPQIAFDSALLTAMGVAAAGSVCTAVLAQLSFNYRMRQKLEPPMPEQPTLW